MAQPLRVLLAVSSPLTAKSLERLLADSQDIEVVGTAQRGRDVMAMMSVLRPDLLCIDDALPLLNALEVAGEVMRAHPCPIVVLSAALTPERKRALLDAGVVDCAPRPDASAASTAATAQAFAARLKMLARVPVIGRRPSGQTPCPPSAFQAVQTLAAPARVHFPHLADRTTSFPDATGNRIIAIGASTGGPIALMTILSALPADFPHPIVCVQHVSRGFLSGLVSWLDQGCRVRVAIAEAGHKASAGTVLFPPEDRHLEIAPNGQIRLSDAPPHDGHRPSATVLFESVARSYGARATAILLTGMGADGATGLCSVREAGGETIAQDEASCVVYGMPRVAIERGGARHIASPTEIIRRLLLLCAPTD